MKRSLKAHSVFSAFAFAAFALALIPATLSAQVCRGIQSSGSNAFAWTMASTIHFADASEQRVAVTAGRIVHVTAFVGLRHDDDFNAQARVAGFSLGIDWEVPAIRGLYFCPSVGGSDTDGPSGRFYSGRELGAGEYEAALGIAYERRVSEDVVLVGSAGVGTLRMRGYEEGGTYPFSQNLYYRDRRASLGATVGPRLQFRVEANYLLARYRDGYSYAWPYGRRSQEIAWQLEIGYALLR